MLWGRKKLSRTFELKGIRIHFVEEVGLHLKPVGTFEGISISWGNFFIIWPSSRLV